MSVRGASAFDFDSAFLAPGELLGFSSMASPGGDNDPNTGYNGSNNDPNNDKNRSNNGNGSIHSNLSSSDLARTGDAVESESSLVTKGYVQYVIDSLVIIDWCISICMYDIHVCMLTLIFLHFIHSVYILYMYACLHSLMRSCTY